MLHLLVYLLEYMKMHGPGNIKNVELTWNNKLIHIVHIVGYFHSCITMHGFINVKYMLGRI
jgi:hypothetical protein